MALRLILAMALTIAAIGLAACGGDNARAFRTVTVTAAETSAQETSPSAPVSGHAILIETRVSNAKRHTGRSSMCPSSASQRSAGAASTAEAA